MYLTAAVESYTGSRLLLEMSVSISENISVPELSEHAPAAAPLTKGHPGS
jgi:hypothetical protein